MGEPLPRQHEHEPHIPPLPLSLYPSSTPSKHLPPPLLPSPTPLTCTLSLTSHPSPTLLSFPMRCPLLFLLISSPLLLLLLLLPPVAALQSLSPVPPPAPAAVSATASAPFPPAGSSAAPVRFLVLGDWGRNGTFNQSLVADQMAVVAGSMRAQFVVSVGDNFYEQGLEHEEDKEFYLSFSRVYHHSTLTLPWFAVLGNHDYYGNALAQLSPRLAQRDMRWRCARSMRLSLDLSPGPLGIWAPNGSVSREAVGSQSGQRAGEGVNAPLLGEGDGEEEEEGEGGWDEGEGEGEGEEEKGSSRYKAAFLDLFFYDTTPLVRKYRNKAKYQGRMDWRGLNTRNWTAQEHTQLQELEDWLSSSSATWRIVIGHHPVYSYGQHGNQKEMVSLVKPLLEKYGVHLYINGHDHDLQHIKRTDSPVHFITSGGGSKAYRDHGVPSGAPGLQFYWPGQGFCAVEVSPSELSVVFHGAGGERLHSLSLTQPSDAASNVFVA